MKKHKKSSNVKSLVKRLFNVRFWSDWDRIRAGSEYISEAVKGVFVISAKQPTESFNQAKARLKLTDKVLLARQKALFRNALLMTILAFGLFVYTIYHLIWGSLHAALLSLSLTGLACSFAFRYHFWYYQIKNKKLGCSVKEWFRQGLLGEKP